MSPATAKIGYYPNDGDEITVNDHDDMRNILCYREEIPDSLFDISVLLFIPGVIFLTLQIRRCFCKGSQLFKRKVIIRHKRLIKPELN